MFFKVFKLGISLVISTAVRQSLYLDISLCLFASSTPQQFYCFALLSRTTRKIAVNNFIDTS